MNPIADLLLKTGAVRHGSFVLSSGKTSDLYVDVKAATLTAHGMYLIAGAMAMHVEGDESIGGPELGVVPLLGAVLYRLGGNGWNNPGFVIRKDLKGHGIGRLLVGDLPAGSQCLLIEDVVTSGASVLRCAEILRAEGHHVSRALAVVDREEGGRELLAGAGITLQALVTRRELLP